LCKFSRFGQVSSVTFVIYGQLFASVNAVMQIGNDLQTDLGGARVFAAALGHQRKVAARLRAEFRRQTHRQSLGARGMGPIGVSAPLQKLREPK